MTEFMFWLGFALILSPVVLYAGRFIMLIIALDVLQKSYENIDFNEE